MWLIGACTNVNDTDVVSKIKYCPDSQTDVPGNETTELVWSTYLHIAN